MLRDRSYNVSALSALSKSVHSILFSSIHPSVSFSTIHPFIHPSSIHPASYSIFSQGAKEGAREPAIKGWGRKPAREPGSEPSAGQRGRQAASGASQPGRGASSGRERGAASQPASKQASNGVKRASQQRPDMSGQPCSERGAQGGAAREKGSQEPGSEGGSAIQPGHPSRSHASATQPYRAARHNCTDAASSTSHCSSSHRSISFHTFIYPLSIAFSSIIILKFLFHTFFSPIHPFIQHPFIHPFI